MFRQRKNFSLVLSSVFAALFLSWVFLFSASAQAAVVINEVMYDQVGTDSEQPDQEWVELYNNGDSAVDLTGYFLEWGGASFDDNSISLSGIISSKKYFLIGGSSVEIKWGVKPDLLVENLVMQNGGSESDGVRLSDGVGYHDTLLYDEPNNNNLPGDDADPGLELCQDVTENHSLSRKITGVDNNLSSDWEDLQTPTPHNSIYEETDIITGDIIYSGRIILNELLPNPSGSDDNEWIELKNLSTTTVDLINWKIGDLNTSTKYTIKNIDFATTTITGLGFFVLPRSITGIALNNSGGETVRLFDSQNNLISEISYSETASDDVVLARDETGIWHWSTTQTNGAENIITAPVVPSSGSGGGSGSAPKKYPSQIKINEVFPNPLGSDAGEWIELKSFEGEMFSLVDWKIKNNLGEYIIKETDFKWPYLEANSFFLLARSTTGLSLKNAGRDEIQLIDPSGKIVSEIKYTGEVIEGTAYMMDKNKNWQWTTSPTHLAENIFTKNNLMPKAYFEVSGQIQTGSEIFLDASESYDPENSNLIYEWHFNAPILFNNFATTTLATTTPIVKIFLDKTASLKIGLKVIDEEGGYDEQTQNIKPVKEIIFWWEEITDQATTSAVKVSKTTTASAGKVVGVKIVKADLEQIKSLALGTVVETTGVVSVLPGILGVNIFYVAGSGIQIYCYKKDFPELKVGDEIKIIGELSSAYGELRIKIKDKSSLQILSHGPEPEPEQINFGDLEDSSEDLVGSLVKVSGEITAVQKDYFWLDDGAGEIKVVIKPTTDLSLENSAIASGDKAEVTGILSKTSSGLRLLPRGKEDLIIEKVLGANVAKTNWSDKIFGQIFVKYFLALSLAVIAILVIVIYRIKRKITNLLPKNN